MMRLTPKGWLVTGSRAMLLSAPCIGCHATVYVRRQGVYGRFGRRHVCPAQRPTAELRRAA